MCKCCSCITGLAKWRKIVDYIVFCTLLFLALYQVHLSVNKFFEHKTTTSTTRLIKVHGRNRITVLYSVPFFLSTLYVSYNLFCKKVGKYSRHFVMKNAQPFWAFGVSTLKSWQVLTKLYWSKVAVFDQSSANTITHRLSLVYEQTW